MDSVSTLSLVLKTMKLKQKLHSMIRAIDGIDTEQALDMIMHEFPEYLEKVDSYLTQQTQAETL